MYQGHQKPNPGQYSQPGWAGEDQQYDAEFVVYTLARDGNARVFLKDLFPGFILSKKNLKTLLRKGPGKPNSLYFWGFSNMAKSEEQNMKLAPKQCNVGTRRQRIRAQPGGECSIEHGQVPSAAGTEQSTDLQRLDSRCFDFMTVREQYPQSRNCTLNFEL